jgi:RNA polymerase sigma-70 factor (ECF subfamily)
MRPDQTTSLSLLERIRVNDPTAWPRLMAIYLPLLHYWCQQWGVRGPDAEDVAQEVFQAVAGAMSQFRRDRSTDTFRGWLRGITRHKLLDHLRRGNNQPHGQGGTDAQRRLLAVPEEDSQLAEEPAEEVSALYHRALDQVRCEFEERTWQAFWRSAVDGHAPVDIAADLGVTPAAVRMAKSRVLRRLREEVGDDLS